MYMLRGDFLQIGVIRSPQIPVLIPNVSLDCEMKLRLARDIEIAQKMIVMKQQENNTSAITSSDTESCLSTKTDLFKLSCKKSDCTIYHLLH